ncbi:MAG TPA: TolC family protein [Acidobacteriaceae bacterium]|jgi:outer membrane protein TolC|nr:TolC family protein [Acidobacteriaceae bacterium]
MMNISKASTIANAWSWRLAQDSAENTPHARNLPLRCAAGMLAGVLVCTLFFARNAAGQQNALPGAPHPAQPAASVPIADTAQSPDGDTTATPALHISLVQAEERARKIEPLWMAAQVAQGTAGYDRRIALAALLPQAIYHGEALYTQSNGVPNSGPLPNTFGPVFIANNSVREYVSQAMVTDKLSVAGAARYRRARALALQAQAEAEIAARGLHAVVTQEYYTVLAAQHKLAAAQAAQQEAQRFDDLTQKLETGREVAHADVIKAQLQLEQRQRDLADAKLALLTAKQSLGVLLFSDPATSYELDDTLDARPDVPAEADVHALAGKSNPEIRSGLAALQAAKEDVHAAWAGYLPALTLGFNYGIDAPYVEATGAGGRQYLGYSAGASLEFPLWDWLTTHDKVKQSQLREHQAQASLSYVQRQWIAELNQGYGELQTAAAAFISLQRTVGEAKESLHLTTLRYQSGEATVLEVVDAQNTYLAAESAVADGAVRYHLARANLERLTGTLP